jgi:DNA-binding MarR family transcriptional regulator
MNYVEPTSSLLTHRHKIAHINLVPAIIKFSTLVINKAIFHVLALKGPLTIYDIHKEVKSQIGLRGIRYASVNKRVRFLEELGYVEKIGIKKTKAGFQASIYELTTKAYLAILFNSINLEDLLIQVNEATASAILGAMTSTR